MVMEAEINVVDGQVDGRTAAVASVVPATIDLGFEEQFDELYARAYGVAYQLLGRRSEAEDVAQEALARCFVHWRRVRGYAEAWVVRVAGNLAIDTWRRSRTIDGPVESSTPSSKTTPGPDPQRIDLHRALGELSRRQRQVLVLRFLADLPEADVAKVLGCSVGSETARDERTRRVAHHRGACRGGSVMMSTVILSDLRDPAPPIPGPAQRAAVVGRARQLHRRRRLAQVGGTLAVVAVLGAGAVAITASDPTGTAGKVAAASTATVFGHAVNVPEGATFTVALTGEGGTFSATANEAGAFSLDQVPPGDYRVTWQWENADGTAVQVGRLPQPVTLGSGRNTMSIPTL